MFLTAAIAFAQGLPSAPKNAAVNSIMAKVFEFVVYPLLALLTVVTLFYFTWGIVQMIMNPGDSESREKGRNHILWGVVGIFIMVSAFGIIQLISNTTTELFK